MGVSIPYHPPPLPPNCTATISWSPPKERVDETEFSVEEISRYDLFIGLAEGEYYREIGILDRYLVQWEEPALEGGDNYFSMTVTDLNGLQSDKSEEIIKWVDDRCSE